MFRAMLLPAQLGDITDPFLTSLARSLAHGLRNELHIHLE